MGKDYKLKKGCGYHLDLLVLAVVVLISSFFGLPWFVANTIPSICHMQSLQKEYHLHSWGEAEVFGNPGATAHLSPHLHPHWSQRPHGPHPLSPAHACSLRGLFVYGHFCPP